jgi:hypothetical protein
MQATARTVTFPIPQRSPRRWVGERETKSFLELPAILNRLGSVGAGELFIIEPIHGEPWAPRYCQCAGTPEAMEVEVGLATGPDSGSIQTGARVLRNPRGIGREWPTPAQRWTAREAAILFHDWLVLGSVDAAMEELIFPWTAAGG